MAKKKQKIPRTRPSGSWWRWGAGGTVLLLLALWPFAPTRQWVIPSATIRPVNGQSFAVPLSDNAGPLFEFPTDSVRSTSTLKVYENGKLLEHGNAPPDDIQSSGHGRYCHATGWLLFSSSDGTDPRLNGRHYEASDQAVPAGWLCDGVLLLVAAALWSLYRLAKPRLAVRVPVLARWERWDEAVLIALVAGLRLYRFWPVAPFRYSDTDAFEWVANSAVFSKGFLLSGRPIGYPLLFKMCSNNLTGVTWAQMLFSLAAWSLLAWRVAAKCATPGLRQLAAVLIAGFSAAVPVSLWDRSLLSESLSVSGACLVVLAVLNVLDRPTRRGYAGVLAASLFWVLARDTNAYSLLPFAAIFGLLTYLGRISREGYGLVAGILMIVLASIWTNQASPRWDWPLRDCLLQYILPEPANVEYFKDQGMPYDELVQRMAGHWPGDPEARIDGRPEVENFRKWYYSDAKRTYMRFLLSHPSWVLDKVTQNTRALLSPAVEFYAPPGYKAPLPSLAEWLLYPDGFLLGIQLLLVVSLVLVHAVRAGRLSSELAILLGTVAFTPLYGALIVCADAGEVQRHALQVGIHLRLGLLLSAFFYLIERKW